MSLTPLLNAAPEIQVHAFAAMAAFALGIVQFTAPKGTLPHRTLGWIWVGLMLVISASSFLIHGIILGAIIYAVLRTRGLPAWGATLAAVPC